jgi:hypothetical protein
MGYKPDHGGIAGIIAAQRGPGVHGCTTTGSWQFSFDRPNPYEELKKESYIREELGVMTPEMKRNTDRRLKTLKAQQEAGIIKPVDYGKEGHPLER